MLYTHVVYSILLKILSQLVAVAVTWNYGKINQEEKGFLCYCG